MVCRHSRHTWPTCRIAASRAPGTASNKYAAVASGAIALLFVATNAARYANSGRWIRLTAFLGLALCSVMMGSFHFRCSRRAARGRDLRAYLMHHTRWHYAVVSGSFVILIAAP